MGNGITSNVVAETDRDYWRYLEKLQERFNSRIANGSQPLFTTSATGLWERFLVNVPEEVRKHYECHACRHFVERFGGLVYVHDDGTIGEAFWEVLDANQELQHAVFEVIEYVRKSTITGMFLSSEKTLGTPVTGCWKHFSITLPKTMVFNNRLLTASQAIAAKTQDFITVSAALREFSLHALDQAVKLLGTDSLYRSEKCLGQAE